MASMRWQLCWREGDSGRRPRRCRSTNCYQISLGNILIVSAKQNNQIDVSVDSLMPTYKAMVHFIQILGATGDLNIAACTNNRHRESVPEMTNEFNVYRICLGGGYERSE